MSGKGNEAYEKLDREISAKYGHLYQRVDPARPAPEFKAWEEPRVSASMAEGMVEVILDHRVSRTGHCACGAVLLDMSPERVATHAAEQLAANGYGNVREALEQLIAATETGLSLVERDIIVRFLRAATERGQE